MPGLLLQETLEGRQTAAGVKWRWTIKTDKGQEEGREWVKAEVGRQGGDEMDQPLLPVPLPCCRLTDTQFQPPSVFPASLSSLCSLLPCKVLPCHLHLGPLRLSSVAHTEAL